MPVLIAISLSREVLWRPCVCMTSSIRSLKQRMAVTSYTPPPNTPTVHTCLSCSGNNLWLHSWSCSKARQGSVYSTCCPSARPLDPCGSGGGGSCVEMPARPSRSQGNKERSWGSSSGNDWQQRRGLQDPHPVGKIMSYKSHEAINLHLSWLCFTWRKVRKICFALLMMISLREILCEKARFKRKCCRYKSNLSVLSYSSNNLYVAESSLLLNPLQLHQQGAQVPDIHASPMQRRRQG